MSTKYLTILYIHMVFLIQSTVLAVGLFSVVFFFFSSRRRHTRCSRDWSSDVCSSDLDGAGKVAPAVLEARGRGVLFDVGHGAGSFSFDVMEKCLAQGFLPDTISSDLYTANIHGPVYDLPTTLSKFLLLGLGLREVIERSTVNAARAFNFGAEIGTLEPGAEADVSVFDLKESDFTFTDADGKSRTGRQKLVPVATVRGGKVFLPAG